MGHFFLCRAVCFPMAYRQSYYKYILVMIFLSFSMDFSRFFEFKLNDDQTAYWTTDLSENPHYVQFNSYWNEILATGLVPLVLLCYMNWKIFRKIKASNTFGLRFIASKKSSLESTMTQNVESPKSPRALQPPSSTKSSRTSKSSKTRSKRGLKRDGQQSIQRKQEKSTAILIAIIVVFVACHVHRLAFRLYEMAWPQASIYEHYMRCEDQGKHHVPIAIYFLAYSHYLFLVISSSINFIIYCAMGRQFRAQLKEMFTTRNQHLMANSPGGN